MSKERDEIAKAHAAALTACERYVKVYEAAYNEVKAFDKHIAQLRKNITKDAKPAREAIENLQALLEHAFEGYVNAPEPPEDDPWEEVDIPLEEVSGITPKYLKDELLTGLKETLQEINETTTVAEDEAEGAQ